MVQSREDKVRSAAPGTSHEIAIRLRVSKQTARRWIRACVEAGTLHERIHWLGKNRYTRVYDVVTGQ